MAGALDKIRKQCITHRSDAYRAASQRLIPHIGSQFRVSEWTGKGYDAYNSQWNGPRHATAGWDWPEIFRVYRDYDRLPIVIWGPDERLCGLGIANTTGKALTLNFLEGDPREGCPLKGRRALIALEVSAHYAQSLGRSELRVEPANSSLESLYRDTYGFTKETPRQGHPYFRKEV